MTYTAAQFNYDLPPSLIAQEPLADRAASRLLVLERASGAIHHRSFADIVEHTDVRMVQSGDRTGLSIEALASPHIVGHLRRQDLDGNCAAKPRIARRVHFAHSANADPSTKLIWPNPGAFEGCTECELSDRHGRRRLEEVVRQVMRGEHAFDLPPDVFATGAHARHVVRPR